MRSTTFRLDRRFQSRNNRGSFSVITAVITGFLLLPAMLFTFEVGRTNLAQKELNAATDSAALAGAVAISKNPSTDQAELTEVGRQAGLMYLQRNILYDHSLQNTTLSDSVDTDNPAKEQGTFDLTYDAPSGIVTAKAAFGMDPAFGNILGLGTTTVRGQSKATTASGNPNDVIVLFDYSNSMSAGNVLRPARDLAAAFVGRLSPTAVHVGLTYFALNPSVAIPLSKTQDNVANVKNRLLSLNSTVSGTNTGDALQAAMNQLNGPQHTPGSKKVIVLITDGLARKPNNLAQGTAHALNVATQAGMDDITVYGIGFFHSGSGAPASDGANFMQQLKTALGGDSEVYTATTISELQAALDKLEFTAGGGVALTN